MHAYIVTGTVQYCIYGLWAASTTSIEVEAPNADAARDRVLATHQADADRQDPYATVVWEERPDVRRVKALAWAA